MKVIEINEDCFDPKTGSFQKKHPRGFYQNINEPHLCLQIDTFDIVGIYIQKDGNLSFVHFMTCVCSGWWGKYRQIERIECKIIEKTS